jgi:hypothetical protein
MSRQLSFLFDEHVALAIQAQLAEREPTLRIYAVGRGEAPPRGTPDPFLLTWIEAHQCLLVTNNRATMPVHLNAHLSNGHHVPGLIQLPRRMNIGEVIDDLLLIWAASEPRELQDQILYLPLKR